MESHLETWRLVGISFLCRKKSPSVLYFRNRGTPRVWSCSPSFVAQKTRCMTVIFRSHGVSSESTQYVLQDHRDREPCSRTREGGDAWSAGATCWPTVSLSHLLGYISVNDVFTALSQAPAFPSLKVSGNRNISFVLLVWNTQIDLQVFWSQWCPNPGLPGYCCR